MVGDRLKGKRVYLIGSLKNREMVIPLAKELRKMGLEIFEDWIAPGPEADDFWRDYEKERGRSYGEALQGWAGTHVFYFFFFHIQVCVRPRSCMPCGT